MKCSDLFIIPQVGINFDSTRHTITNWKIELSQDEWAFYDNIRQKALAEMENRKVIHAGIFTLLLLLK